MTQFWFSILWSVNDSFRLMLNLGKKVITSKKILLDTTVVKKMFGSYITR